MMFDAKYNYENELLIAIIIRILTLTYQKKAITPVKLTKVFKHQCFL